MATYSKTYRATAAPSVGTYWHDTENIYDEDTATYAYRSMPSTSATHINGFGINLPNDAVVQSVEVRTRVYAANNYGHIYIYMASEAATSTYLFSTQIVKGASIATQYVTQTYTADELAAKLNEKSLYSGNVIEFLKNLRLRFVIGSTSSSDSCRCRIHDNYVVVNYKIPGYIITVNAGTGGTVTGGGEYDNGTTATLKATPNTGYKFKQWSDGNTSNPRTVTVSANATYTAQFEKSNHTVTFRNQDGTVVKSSQFEHGKTLGTLPAVSRSGYTFAGWIPCAPAKKTDNTVLDSMRYDGSVFNALNKSYKYSNNLALHIEAYMSDWVDIVNSQIVSCTEGGGWGLGYNANTVGHGVEIHTGSYSGIDLGFGTDGVFADRSWNAFDVVFANGTLEAYVNGVKKGEINTAGSSISYNADNTIFVGAEAASNATTPGGNYFNGFISNVFIANQGTRLQIATESSIVEKDVDYYPVWRINTTHTVSVSASPTTGGTVSGGGTYEHGSTATLTATPNTGYKFKQWSDGNTSNPRTVTVLANATYTAVFEKSGVNKIYVGTAQPKEIYIGTQKVKGVYVGTKAIYEK